MVQFVFTPSNKEFIGPTKTFDCPACGAEDVKSRAFGNLSGIKLFFVIPLIMLKQTHLKCSHCKSKIYLSMKPKLIDSATKDEINHALLYHASTTGKVLTICSVLICLIPYLSLPLCIYSMYLVRGTKGSYRTFSIFALIISITVTTLVTLSILISNL